MDFNTSLGKMMDFVASGVVEFIGRVASKSERDAKGCIWCFRPCLYQWCGQNSVVMDDYSIVYQVVV